MKKPTVKLTGTNGNALAIIGRVARALKMAGFDKEYIDKYKEEALSGDYNNVIQTTFKYVEVE